MDTVNTQETARVFIALELPEEARVYLAAAQRTLQNRIPRNAVRWTNSEGFHLTLVFLGDVSVTHLDGILASMARAAQGMPPFSLHLSSLGCFPSVRHPSVLWLGVAGDLEPLEHLQRRLVRMLDAWLELDEKRAFRPHVTLGRVRVRDRSSQRQVAQVMQEVTHEVLREDAPPPLAPVAPLPDGQAPTDQAPTDVMWTVSQVSLIRSELRPEGSRYTTLRTVALEP
jgi:2'-5' RNA ligase